LRWMPMPPSAAASEGLLPLPDTSAGTLLIPPDAEI
jgi:hypothetical protein